ncbi:MFS transporter [Microlunatus parietis]|uniref:MFS transporter n=1 Tax=Microlunatus parietis TaxID=682979 RepID=A0A7Y9I3H2_9ACTN|nr:MFS transporter [Microlunatus parietis]NYE69462.1 hypothetical protein [Microlunatus parietis]
MLSILRNARFRTAWLSYVTSAAAGSLTPVAITLFVLDTSGDLAVLGLALGARTVGFVAGSVLGGVISDSFPRRSVLIGSSLLRGAAILAAIPAFAAPVPLLCLAIFVAGTGEGTFRGVYQALVGESVNGPERQRANALSTLSSRILLVAGPTIAALGYAVVGGPATLAFAGLLWLTSAATALILPRGERPPSDAARARPFADYGELLREVVRHRWFVAGLAALVIWLALGFAVQQLTLPLVSRTHFGGDVFLGVALGCYSAGAVVAALVLARWQPAKPGLVGFVGLSLYGLVPLALACAAVSPEVALVLIMAGYALGGAGIEAFNIPWFSAIQREFPPERLGRVFSFDFMISHGVAPLGLILLPYALDAAGTMAVLVACGLATIAAALGALAVPGSRTFAEPRLVAQRVAEGDR